ARRVDGRRLDGGRVEAPVAPTLELGVERGGLAEGRDAEDRGKARGGVEALAVGDLLVEGKARRIDGVHRARALVPAGPQPQEPAVVEQLPRRRRGVERKLLEAAGLEAQ